MRSRKLKQGQANFMLAGNSIFTVKNVKTGNRFTYKVERADPRSGQYPDSVIYFVSVLNGLANTNSFYYLGIIRNEDYIHGRKSRISRKAQSNLVFQWLFDNIDNLPKIVEFWHEGLCGRCGRKLTVPESIECGFGLDCIRKMSAEFNREWAVYKDEFSRREAKQERMAFMSDPDI